MRLGSVLMVLAALVFGFVSGQALLPGDRAAATGDAAGGASSAGAALPERGGTAASTSLAPAAAPPDPGVAAGDLGSEETRNIGIFRRATSSVVFITSLALRRDFFSLDVLQIPRGNGTGFVWDRDGHVVTNFHVIEGGDRFSVTLADQSTWDAVPAGVAPDKDLAVLKLEAPADKLAPLPLGRSADLAVGQTVLALGNPFGLDHSLTVGVVSALGRELTSPNGRSIRDVIQTDAAINPGNSGGPLLDSRGRVVGVNSAIFSPSGAFAGIGFAVPVDTVRALVPQLIAHGRPIQAGIGVSILPDRYAERLELKGVIVRDVTPRGPADRAGLQGLEQDRNGRPVLGDIIVGVNGQSVENSDDLLHVFEGAGVGATVTLTVERDGKRRDVRLALVQVR